jgi:hypothetical protein
MYNPSRFEKEKDFPARDIIQKIFDCYPKTYQEYQDTKSAVKAKISSCMKELKDFLLNDQDRAKFLDRAFFDRKVDFFVIYDDDIFHIFDKNEVWTIILNNLKVENSSSNQKVVFKTDVICAEIEMRTTDDGKYPTIFMPMSKRVIFDLLSRNIKQKKELTRFLWLYGNAIKNYKH